MGMPQIPERHNKPELSEIIISLIESVAIEELALAHILNAEGEKLQEIIKKFSHCAVNTDDLHKVSHSTNTLINSIIMKEWILLNKLNSALEIYNSMETPTTHTCRCNK